jgi:sRNA-binding carbon storage regulator CsrA
MGESLLKGAEEALVYSKGNKKNAVTHKVNAPKNVDVFEIQHNLRDEPGCLDRVARHA